MTLDLQPVLVGNLVTLRPLHEDDFEALYAVACDPLIWQQHPARDRHEREVFRRFVDDALAGGGAFVVLDNATGDIIGSSRYHDYSADRRDVEIGWTFLARSHWGGRCNGEMKQLMLAHAFTTVDRVLFLVGPDNERSQRAVENIGARRTGEIRSQRGHESWVYGIERTQVPHSCGTRPWPERESL